MPCMSSIGSSHACKKRRSETCHRKMDKNRPACGHCTCSWMALVMEIDACSHVRVETIMTPCFVQRASDRSTSYLRQNNHLEAPLHLPNCQRSVQTICACQHEHFGPCEAQKGLTQALIPPSPASGSHCVTTRSFCWLRKF